MSRRGVHYDLVIQLRQNLDSSLGRRLQRPSCTRQGPTTRASSASNIDSLIGLLDRPLSVVRWSRRKQLASTDRVYHDLRCRAEIIEMSSNLLCLARVKVLCCGMQTLVAAQCVSRAMSNMQRLFRWWQCSRVAFVSPGLRAHDARRLRELQSEVGVQRMGSTSAAAGSNDDGAQATLDETRFPAQFSYFRGRGTGRGQGDRRTLPPPDATQ